VPPSAWNQPRKTRARASVTLRSRLILEALEEREVPATFTVDNLLDSGPGSLRQAILDANANPGADLIDFSVAGMIKLTSGALPDITDAVDIDGTTAPGYSSSPVVEINCAGFGGLKFTPGSSGSALKSMAIVKASDNGVTLNGSNETLVVGNYIGLRLDGLTTAGNKGSGLELLGTHDVVVGGATAAERNVISANAKHGIRIRNATLNTILGNYIGVDATGTLDRGNLKNGVVLTDGSTLNTIGGTAGNVISGNDANGILISNASRLNTVSANLIGLNAPGAASVGNKLDGVRLENADENQIGNVDPVTGIDYYDADDVTVPVSGWQGIRAADTPDDYFIAGTSELNGLLFVGTIQGSGSSYLVDYPGAYNTSVYGPDNLDGDVIRLVGSYKNPDYQTAPVEVNSFLYEGTLDELGDADNYRTISYPGAKYTFAHSTMGGLVVGNYDSPDDNGTYSLPLGPGKAFIYDVATDTYVTDISYPGALSNTAYGIWYNGGTSYTICGGYSLDPVNNFSDPDKPIGTAFLVDYDSATGNFTNWTSFVYPKGLDFISHFQGISSVEKGVYTLCADSLAAGSSDPAQGSWVTVRRQIDGGFGEAVWVDLNYEGVDPMTNITSSNSVIGNQVVGIVIGTDTFSYQSTVNVGFQLSNVISGNGANGVGLYAANDNAISMNFIGTDATGAFDRGNAQNGILLTNGSARNLVGGQATGGNDPTDGVFVRPPQGNLISGNDRNGVLINAKASDNLLSGNFIGTTSEGSQALGNTLDGVAIEKADGNSLIGCTFEQDPFVFYNVISGNGGNGLRIKDANDTTIQANFFGVGADNNSAVGNGGNGVAVEGSSQNTVMGGPIPLGNVVAANAQNGIVVKDTASGFVTYNTFCGLAAFSDNPTLGNGRDGMLITTSGSDILIRTNVITRNGDDGIEVSGNARGVRIAGNIIGLNTAGNLPMGNLDNGVEVGGTATGTVVGGPQPTFNIIPHNAISANGANGVAVVGNAANTTISHSYIGTGLLGLDALGNALSGILVSSGATGTTIGSSDLHLRTVVSGNALNGIELRGSNGTTIINSWIGLAGDGVSPMGNGSNGIFIQNASDNRIGRANGSPANRIAYNTANGIFVASGAGNGIKQNSIFENGVLGISLALGANKNQPAPVLGTATVIGERLRIEGTLTAKANSQYVLEFFANADDGPSGRVFLGSLTVQTNAAGVANFVYIGLPPPVGANFCTATATDSSNNTSMFSTPIALTA